MTSWTTIISYEFATNLLPTVSYRSWTNLFYRRSFITQQWMRFRFCQLDKIKAENSNVFSVRSSWQWVYWRESFPWTVQFNSYELVGFQATGSELIFKASSTNCNKQFEKQTSRNCHPHCKGDLKSVNRLKFVKFGERWWMHSLNAHCISWSQW